MASNTSSRRGGDLVLVTLRLALLVTAAALLGVVGLALFRIATQGG